MKYFLIKPSSSLKGNIYLAGDKSIAHRCIILSAISQGKTIIKNFPTSRDCSYTVAAFKKLGIRIIQKSKAHRKSPTIIVFGKGLTGLKNPRGSIFVGDSATTLRLILGILAGQNFKTRLRVGKSLSQRPMRRVTLPLRLMGAKISARRKAQSAKLEEYPPITISGGNLKPITYRIPVASAQVKSAILLAGLYAKGKTEMTEPIKTRDHTERMLKLFKADIKVKENKIVIRGKRELISPKRIYIPGDISSASFFLALASILPDSKLLVKNVSLNPSRMGIIRVLKRMGADIRFSVPGSRFSEFEPMGDIVVRSSKLRGTIVKKEEAPSLIDELPILMVAACFAEGRTMLEGVSELRLKETDRIRSVSKNLTKMGAQIKVLKGKLSEKILIRGVKQLKGARLKSFADHRTAMSMIVAGLAAKGKTFIDDVSCIDKSFPEFLNILKELIK